MEAVTVISIIIFLIMWYTTESFFLSLLMILGLNSYIKTTLISKQETRTQQECVQTAERNGINPDSERYNAFIDECLELLQEEKEDAIPEPSETYDGLEDDNDRGILD